MQVAALLSVVFAMSCQLAPPTDTLTFAGRIGAVETANIFSEKGYYVWCGSPIRGEDGKYYLFYARWKTGAEGRAPGDEKTFQNMSGWLKYSEIAAAVADHPTGPYKSLGLVLKGTGDPSRWDYINAHNPHVQRFDGKVYLYYISISHLPGNADWMTLANNQRIGVAVADSVTDLAAGKYRRCATPLVAVDGVNTFARVVNPSVTRGRDGRYLMMFKSRSAPTGGQMTMWVSESENPDGPFKIAGPALTDNKYEAEDPYFWYDRERDRYYAIVKDYSQKSRQLSPQFGALALMTSEKGWGDWRPAANPLVSLREYVDVAGRKHELTRLERPQLLFDEAGKPTALFAAAAETDVQKAPTFNLALPIR